MVGTGGTFPGRTVTLNAHWLELPAASVTEHVTVWGPTANAEPEAGLQTGTPTPEQLSETAGLNVTTLVKAVCALVTTMSAGQIMVGGVRSRTMTRAVQEL